MYAAPIPTLRSFRPKLCPLAWSHRVFQSGRAFSNLASLSFHLQPIQNGKPENAFDGQAADWLALWPPSVRAAPGLAGAPVRAAACAQLQPAPAAPGPKPAAPAPPSVSSTAPRGAVPALPTQSRLPERSGGAPGDHVSVSASFPPTPRVLPTPGLPTNGALHSTSFPTSPATKEPRGDV